MKIPTQKGEHSSKCTELSLKGKEGTRYPKRVLFGGTFYGFQKYASYMKLVFVIANILLTTNTVWRSYNAIIRVIAGYSFGGRKLQIVKN